MKSIRELRHNSIRLKPDHGNSSLKFLLTQKIDFDVYLPTKGMNLQRELVWTDLQKSELIKSVIYGRHIPDMAIVHTKEGEYQIIDGKQRLSALFGFVRGEFFVILDEEAFTFERLPEDYQLAILHYYTSYNIVVEYTVPVSDEEKIEWFKFINFAGTQQDAEHLRKLG